jgi:hypothetical protein
VIETWGVVQSIPAALVEDKAAVDALVDRLVEDARTGLDHLGFTIDGDYTVSVERPPARPTRPGHPPTGDVALLRIEIPVNRGGR